MKSNSSGVEYFPWSTDEIPESVPFSIRDLVGRPLRIVDGSALVTQEFASRRVTIRTSVAGLISSISVEASDGTEV